jgi:hypothetical protein
VNSSFRIQVGVQTDGTVLEGPNRPRQYAVASALVQFLFDEELPIGLIPDIAQYHYDPDGSLRILLPLLTTEWIEVPIDLLNDRLLQACTTGEITLRLVTPSHQRDLRATAFESERWLSDNPLQWQQPAVRDRLLVQLGRDRQLNNHPAASKVSTIADAENMYRIRLRNLVLPERTTCIFCDRPNPDSREHAVPFWARPEDEDGITVAACDPCNNSLSGLEDSIAQISREAPSEFRDEQSAQLCSWAVKTIWVITRALGMDALHGSGDATVSRLLGKPSVATGDPEAPWAIARCHASIDPSPPGNYLTYSTDDTDPAWAVLQIANLTISVWYSPEPASGRTEDGPATPGG